MSSTTGARIFDEVFDADGNPRAHAEGLVAELERLGAESLVAAGTLRDAIFMRQGITFDLKTDDGREILLELVEHCDARVEDFRTGVMESSDSDSGSCGQ